MDQITSTSKSIKFSTLTRLSHTTLMAELCKELVPVSLVFTLWRYYYSS